MKDQKNQEKTIEGYQPGWGKFTVRLKYEEGPTVEFLHRSPYAHIEDNDVNGLATLAYQTSGFGTNINRIIYPDKIPHGDSPLGYAVRNNRVECTRILLILMAYKKDYDCLNYKNKDNQNVLQIAYQSLNPDIKKLFFRIKDGDTKLRTAEGLIHVLKRSSQQEFQALEESCKGPRAFPVFPPSDDEDDNDEETKK